MSFAVVGPADLALVRDLVGEPAEIGADTIMVLAFGSRAARELVPDFRAMELDHGRAALSANGKWTVMALYCDYEHYGQTAIDLMAAKDLLDVDGLVALMQPAPPMAWPESIAFLVYDGERKTGKCVLCGKSGISAYTGNGLKWLLCMPHAVRVADWAVDHLPAMLEHAAIAREDAVGAKLERTAARMQTQLIEGVYAKRDETASVPSK